METDIYFFLFEDENLPSNNFNICRYKRIGVGAECGSMFQVQTI